MRVAVADDVGVDGVGGRDGRGRETAWLDFGDRTVLLGVVNETMSGWLAATAVVVVVVADRQQSLAVSVSGDHAVAPQTLLTLLKGGRATPKESPAALSLTGPRRTAYIYIKPETHQLIIVSRVSRRAGVDTC